MIKLQTQQGDCILEKVNLIPKTAKKVNIQGNYFVLLKGEGVNEHRLQTATLDDVEVYQEGDTLFLHAKKDVDLVHEEHGTTTIKKGIYKRRIEREFSYEEMESRNVRD